MNLSPGERLGPYEILAPIAAGGMGAVWKAKDTRLNRIVAVKVSRETFSDRFEREARAVAALNHPHICTLHDVGPNYLVMEFVEGTPLKGPLPVEKAFEYTRQICDALDAAHRKGITHRDLKPGNVLVTKQGIKLLDFGLARVVGDETLTTTGAVMGTPAYMSPEQWQGQPGDARSDIYALGCVLYEMLTGKRVAEGRSLLEPGVLESVVGRCLAKDPDARWQSAHDVMVSLELIPSDRAVGPGNTRKQALAWVAISALALLALLALWTLWPNSQAGGTATATKLDLDLRGTATEFNIGPDALLSPDGSRMVMVVQATNGISRLLTRRLDQAQPAELPGSEGAFAPFFKPDGQWIGFFVRGKLRKARVDGGGPIDLCEAPAGRGGTWTQDGIVASLDTQSGLSLVPEEGGTPKRITELEPGENSHRWPQALPDGKRVLFASNKYFANFSEGTVEVVSLAALKRAVVAEHVGMYPRYLRSGHLTYVHKGILYAVAFDLKSLKIHGQRVPLVQELSCNTIFGYARVDFSATGRALYRQGRIEGLSTIRWMNSAGKREDLANEPGDYQNVRISPDDKKVAWNANHGASSDIWILNLQRGGTPARLTDGPGVYTCPVWSPDSRFIVFNSPDGIFYTRADGASKPQPLFLPGRPLLFPWSFTKDGKTLCFSESKREGNTVGGTIWTVSLEADSEHLRAGDQRKFWQTKCALSFPAFSPDGRWLAYQDAESGTYEVYVRRFPDNGNLARISNEGGLMPVWSKNGHELFYRTEEDQIMVVTYNAEGEVFEVEEKPRLWSEIRLAHTGHTPNYDLAPDGRFAVLMPAEEPESAEARRHVTLVLNCFDENTGRVLGSK